ncbi:MAG: glycosyltransferase family 1 protein [Planctomycetaceae bacterium]|nr:glycosyltransferase family 1 protein [Planctomycetaceae bacterium]
MRIFTAVRHSFDPSFYYGRLWSDNFHPALRRLGHELVESGVDLLPASRFMDAQKPFTREEQQVRAAITDRIVDEITTAHAKAPLDLVLTYFYDSHFDPSGFSAIRRLGVPTVNFYCNSIHQFELANEISRAVDFAWHAERDAASKYRSVGANPVWIQMAADPAIYHPVDVGQRRPAACFVGQRYADRPRWVRLLMRENVPVEVYGSGWIGASVNSASPATTVPGPSLGRRTVMPGSARAYLESVRSNLASSGVAGGVTRTLRQIAERLQSRKLSELTKAVAHGPVSFEDMLRLFSGCELILNFSNVWADGRAGSELVPHVRLRDFEVPMCRGCYLTGHTDELQEFYEIGTEIETYRTPEEFIDKAKHYLSNPRDAERLRSAGYRRATQDHTWERRFLKLFEAIGA